MTDMARKGDEPKMVLILLDSSLIVLGPAQPPKNINYTTTANSVV